MYKFFVLTFFYLLGFTVLVNANEREIANEVKRVITQILKDEKNYNELNKTILKSNEKINKKQILLDEIQQKKYILENELNNLKTEQKNVESNIVSLTVKKYSKSIAIKYAKEKSEKSIFDNEVYTILHSSINKEVSKYNEISIVLQNKISLDSKLIAKLNAAKKEYEKLLLVNKKQKRDQKRNLNLLRGKHKFYINKLEKMNKEKSKNLLNDISSIENPKVKDHISQNNEFLSAANDIKNKFNTILQYKQNEEKTIAPLKIYTIVEKFGIYYDSTSKVELFNKSISLQSAKRNAQVSSIFNGEISLIKKNDGRFKNIVIVKYDDGLNGIYSNLDEVSSQIFVGMKIKKGFNLGVVDNILIFQATKNNKYIDPEKLFK